MKHLFTSQFLFQINAISLGLADRIFLVAGIALLVSAAVLKLAAVYAPTPVDAKYRQKLFTLFLYIGLAEIIWFGFRFQNIRIFGTHFTAALVGLIGLIWFVVLAISIARHYGSEKRGFEKEQVRQKYLK